MIKIQGLAIIHCSEMRSAVVAFFNLEDQVRRRYVSVISDFRSKSRVSGLSASQPKPVQMFNDSRVQTSSPPPTKCSNRSSAAPDGRSKARPGLDPGFNRLKVQGPASSAGVQRMVYHVQRLAASVSRLSTRYASVIATAKEALKGCGPGLPSFDWPQRLANY